MEELYVSYKCKGCNKETILITDDVAKTISTGRYISCAHCGSKKLIKEKATDDLRECMKARRYKRNNHGAIIEIT